jgi:hypothetical protein
MSGIKITDLPKTSSPYSGDEDMLFVQSNVAKTNSINSLVGYLTGAVLSATDMTYTGGISAIGRTVVRDALVGDITAPVGSNTTTISDNVVTNAKLANMNEATFKGRLSGIGTGDPQDLSVSQIQSLIITPTSIQTVLSSDSVGSRLAINAQSTSIGFLDRFDRSDRYPLSSTITHLSSMPEVGDYPYRVNLNLGPLARVLSGALECTGDSLPYFQNRVSTVSGGNFSMGLVVEMIRTAVYETALNNGGFNVSICDVPMVNDSPPALSALSAGNISGLENKFPIHINFDMRGITSINLYGGGASSIGLSCLNASYISSAYYPWNTELQQLPLSQKNTILIRTTGDILEIEAVGIGTLIFTHPDISLRIGSPYTYFFYEPNGPLLNTQYKFISRLYRWWAMAEAYDQLPGYGIVQSLPTGNTRFSSPLRLFPAGQTSKRSLVSLVGSEDNNLVIYGGSRSVTPRGTYNRYTGGNVICEGMICHDYGHSDAGASTQGWMVGAVDSTLDTPVSSLAGVETLLSIGRTDSTPGMETADWEKWFYAGTLNGTDYKRIRLYNAAVVGGNLVDSNHAGTTPLSGLTGFWTIDVTKYVNTAQGMVFYSELKANGVLIHANRTTSGFTNTYLSFSLFTTTSAAGGVVVDTNIRQIARVNPL